MWRLSWPLRVHILSPMSQPLSAFGDYHQRLRRLSLGVYFPVSPFEPVWVGGKNFLWIELRSIPPLDVISITKLIDYFTYRSHFIVLLHARTTLYYVFHSTHIIYCSHSCTRTSVRVPLHLHACACRYLCICEYLCMLLNLAMHGLCTCMYFLAIHIIDIPIGSLLVGIS